MVIYRPHRGGLKEAMAEAREFPSVEDMLAYIVEEHTDAVWGPAFDLDDLVLGREARDDSRTGWHDTRYVYIKRYYRGEVYDPPAPIGFFSEDYER